MNIPLPAGCGDAAYLAFLERGRNGQRLIGDITPSYAMLPGDTFARMARLARNTRFVFLMRDPVERLWSNLRMAAKRAARAGGAIEDHAARLAEAFVSGANKGLEGRGDYARTIHALDQAVPKASVLYLFFETLFTSATVERLCAFLGISHVPAAFDEVVHRGKSMDLDPDLRARLRAHLDPQYQFVTARFPGQVPDKWALA